jgi:hypothetical protein
MEQSNILGRTTIAYKIFVGKSFWELSTWNSKEMCRYYAEVYADRLSQTGGNCKHIRAVAREGLRDSITGAEALHFAATMLQWFPSTESHSCGN